MRIVQTGGIFIKFSPKQVNIFVDGKLSKKTDFFAGSALISRLQPKKYSVSVRKEEYFPWEKTLDVKEKEVTEAKSVILFPRAPNFTTSSQIVEFATSSPATQTIAVSGFTIKKENGGLYLLNKETNLFEEFFEPVKDFKVSPDSQKIVYSSESEIWVLFVENNDQAPQRKAGEKIFLTRFSEKIGDIFWLNSDYLIFNTGNRIKISEIDNRDRLNIYDLGEFENPKILWNQNEKKLYVLSQKNLFISQNLLP